MDCNAAKEGLCAFFVVEARGYCNEGWFEQMGVNEVCLVNIKEREVSKVEAEARTLGEYKRAGWG